MRRSKGALVAAHFLCKPVRGGWGCCRLATRQAGRAGGGETGRLGVAGTAGWLGAAGCHGRRSRRSGWIGGNRCRSWRASSIGFHRFGTEAVNVAGAGSPHAVEGDPADVLTRRCPVKRVCISSGRTHRLDGRSWVGRVAGRAVWPCPVAVVAICVR